MTPHCPWLAHDPPRPSRAGTARRTLPQSESQSRWAVPALRGGCAVLLNKMLPPASAPFMAVLAAMTAGPDDAFKLTPLRGSS